MAAVWTAFFAASFHVALPWTAPVALALAVWIFYAADRLSDSQHEASSLEDRHRFHARHARGFFVAIGFAVPTVLALLAEVPHTVRLAWLLLVLPLIAYAAAVHWLKLRVAKEWMVGLFFAVAIGAPSLLNNNHPAEWLCVATFGVLCWLNCVRIARSESAATDRATAWAVNHFRGATLAFAITGAAIAVFVPQARAVALAIVTAALLLRALDLLEPRVSAVRMRALADAALLTPLILWPLMRYIQ
ncbi:hypothetical protein SAMN05444167_0200 [Terriglobus roseus]|uniref:4-hydroxybenzoate polyprenyltransferase n=1 Tax=Terriglobus roseus TaxID=392734 RepID=A0A1G7F4E3_9BACT|nr:hypothetical protein SAMN05444167_0200 [Terriglobus roseus]